MTAALEDGPLAVHEAVSGWWRVGGAELPWVLASRPGRLDLLAPRATPDGGDTRLELRASCAIEGVCTHLCPVPPPRGARERHVAALMDDTAFVLVELRPPPPAPAGARRFGAQLTLQLSVPLECPFADAAPAERVLASPLLRSSRGSSLHSWGIHCWSGVLTEVSFSVGKECAVESMTSWALAVEDPAAPDLPAPAAATASRPRAQAAPALADLDSRALGLGALIGPLRSPVRGMDAEWVVMAREEALHALPRTDRPWSLLSVAPPAHDWVARDGPWSAGPFPPGPTLATPLSDDARWLLLLGPGHAMLVARTGVWWCSIRQVSAAGATVRDGAPWVAPAACAVLRRPSARRDPLLLVVDTDGAAYVVSLRLPVAEDGEGAGAGQGGAEASRATAQTPSITLMRVARCHVGDRAGASAPALLPAATSCAAVPVAAAAAADEGAWRVLLAGAGACALEASLECREGRYVLTPDPVVGGAPPPRGPFSSAEACGPCPGGGTALAAVVGGGSTTSLAIGCRGYSFSTHCHVLAGLLPAPSLHVLPAAASGPTLLLSWRAARETRGVALSSLLGPASGEAAEGADRQARARDWGGWDWGQEGAGGAGDDLGEGPEEEQQQEEADGGDALPAFVSGSDPVIAAGSVAGLPVVVSDRAVAWPGAQWAPPEEAAIICAIFSGGSRPALYLCSSTALYTVQGSDGAPPAPAARCLASLPWAPSLLAASPSAGAVGCGWHAHGCRLVRAEPRGDRAEVVCEGEVAGIGSALPADLALLDHGPDVWAVVALADGRLALVALGRPSSSGGRASIPTSSLARLAASGAGTAAAPRARPVLLSVVPACGVTPQLVPAPSIRGASSSGSCVLAVSEGGCAVAEASGEGALRLTPAVLRCGLAGRVCALPDGRVALVDADGDLRVGRVEAPPPQDVACEGSGEGRSERGVGWVWRTAPLAQTAVALAVSAGCDALSVLALGATGRGCVRLFAHAGLHAPAGAHTREEGAWMLPRGRLGTCLAAVGSAAGARRRQVSGWVVGCVAAPDGAGGEDGPATGELVLVAVQDTGTAGDELAASATLPLEEGVVAVAADGCSGVAACTTCLVQWQATPPAAPAGAWTLAVQRRTPVPGAAPVVSLAVGGGVALAGSWDGPLLLWPWAEGGDAVPVPGSTGQWATLRALAPAGGHARRAMYVAGAEAGAGEVVVWRVTAAAASAVARGRLASARSVATGFALERRPGAPACLVMATSGGTVESLPLGEDVAEAMDADA